MPYQILWYVISINVFSIVSRTESQLTLTRSLFYGAATLISYPSFRDLLTKVNLYRYFRRVATFGTLPEVSNRLVFLKPTKFNYVTNKPRSFFFV